MTHTLDVVIKILVRTNFAPCTHAKMCHLHGLQQGPLMKTNGLSHEYESAGHHESEARSVTHYAHSQQGCSPSQLYYPSLQNAVVWL